jgi:hypothetical protein
MAFKNLMNGDSKLAAEDQTAIVLRKIYFYLELLNIFLKQQPNSMGNCNHKLEFLFRTEGFE